MRREQNSHDQDHVGQEGHQDRKKRARNENLRLRGDFEPTHVGDLGPAGGVRGGNINNITSSNQARPDSLTRHWATGPANL